MSYYRRVAEDPNRGKRVYAKVKYVGSDRSYKRDKWDSYFLINRINGKVQPDEYYVRWTNVARTFFENVKEEDELTISFILSYRDTRGLGIFESIKCLQDRYGQCIKFIQTEGRIRKEKD